jgi:two-component system OmpR family sensor kinase
MPKVKDLRTRFGLWINSIQAYMLALVLTVIAAIAAFTLPLQAMDDVRRSSRLTVYELSRLVAGEALVTPRPSRITLELQMTEPSPLTSASEVLVSHRLASHLGRQPKDVRVYLEADDRRDVAMFERKRALYGADFSSDIELDGPFTVAIRNSAGQWRIYRNRVPPPLGSLRLGILNSLLVFVLVGLGLWIGARIARQIRSFAMSADRMSIGLNVDPIPPEGPTELQQAGRAINAMHARIRRYVRERESITAAVAHDLRAPLARVKFHVASAPDKLRAAVEAEVNGMESMIKSTLEFVESDTRLPAREPVDLTILVLSLADDFCDAGQDVQVLGSEPITTEGDPLLLKRLVSNLIENALRYGSRAALTTCKEADRAIIDVADDGPGMSPELIARAFEPFFRGEPSRNRRTGGTGLGLSIAQSIAAAHGGSVHLENMPKGGLRARVILPQLRSGKRSRNPDCLVEEGALLGRSTPTCTGQ